jgi:hypothetical protein
MFFVIIILVLQHLGGIIFNQVTFISNILLRGMSTADGLQQANTTSSNAGVNINNNNNNGCTNNNNNTSNNDIEP